MTDVGHISERLQALGFNPSVIDRYNEPHRFYHTIGHLCTVLDNIDIQDDELFLAAVFHDAVYDPKRNDNEELSAKLFRQEAVAARLSSAAINSVCDMIMDTQNHQPRSEKSATLVAADLRILEEPLENLIAYERQIFREYQFVDFPKYREGRIGVLNKLNVGGKLNGLLNFVKYNKPQIGVFCGSFNPFHKGHFNVLQKAEKIFDKVIIAFGQNPDKNEKQWKRPSSIAYRQIEEYQGLLTDFIGSLGYEVVVIRGLRNSTDFQYEQNQYRYIQELMPEIRIVNIFCDKEFEHISSSGIRTLEKFNRHQNYLLE